MAFRLDGKTALVFGGGTSGKGISNGQAICLAYAKSGAKVMVVDSVPSRAHDTVALISKEGGEAIPATADVSNARDIQSVVDSCMKAYGSIDILHNNVAFSEFSNIIDMPEELWDRTMYINLKSVFMSCKSVLPIMLKQGSGRIISTSSILSRVISEYPLAAYTASKAGLEALMQYVAVAYGEKGVRANSVVPGLINSPQIREHSGLDSAHAEMAARHARSPTGAMGETWDIAWASVFLASDEACYVNGHSLIVDGGLTGKQA